MSIEIRVRYSTGTYTARIKGNKLTASCTINARQAAQALAIKMGIDPDQLLQVAPEPGNMQDVQLFRLDCKDQQ